jgi:phosphatidylserine decarboxylase
MLSTYGKREWLTILLIGVLCVATFAYLQWWWLLATAVVVDLALLSFFRDPHRNVPTQKHIHVSPADGTISSIHELDHFEPFGEGAVCIRIFLSVFNVHVNRAPCHCSVASITHKPGKYLNALKPESAEENESNTLVLIHPVRRTPIAAVRQVSGMIARTIECGVVVGDTLQRGQRFGMIKLGSTTELYLPKSAEPEVLVKLHQKVKGGATMLARVSANAKSTATTANAAHVGDHDASPAPVEGEPNESTGMPSSEAGRDSRIIDLTPGSEDVEPSERNSDSTVTDAIVPPPEDDTPTTSSSPASSSRL